MGLFRRTARDANDGRGGASSAAVTGFWQWWHEHSDAVEAALADNDPDRLAALVAPRVAAIHPDLAWEFGSAGAGAGGFSGGFADAFAGAFADGTAEHQLVVGGDGSAELRTLAERWRRAGPPDGPRWVFRSARQADPSIFTSGAVLDLDGTPFDPSALVAQARADDERCRLDVVVHHPRFDAMSEDARMQVSFLALHWALGEDDVERWLGEVTTTVHAPIDTVPFGFLGSLVSQLADRWSGDRWAMLEGRAGEHRVVATVRHPLHRVDHPLFDEHVVVRLPYADRTDDGLPGEQALAALRRFEDGLTDRLGGSAFLVAHETSAGERLLHLYGDSMASVVPLVEATLAGYSGHPGGGAAVRGDLDPAWRGVEHLRP